jgi:hypothetical protein
MTYATSQSQIGAGTAWVNPGNATGAPDTVNLAVATIAKGAASKVLILAGYGFAVPAGSTINGVTVTLSFSWSGDALGLVSVQLYNTNTPIGNAKTIAPGVAAALGNLTFGSEIDGWSASLTAAIINGTFGVGVQCDNTSAPTSASVLSVDAINTQTTFSVGSVIEGGVLSTSAILARHRFSRRNQLTRHARR